MHSETPNLKQQQQYGPYKLRIKFNHGIDIFDLTLVLIKGAMIIVTIALVLLYIIRFMVSKSEKAKDDLNESIDWINKLLYHMILVIFFFIAIITIWTFRRFWRVAVDKSREKVSALVHDTKKALRMKKSPKIENKSHLKDFSEYAKGLASSANHYVPVSDMVKHTTNAIDNFVNDEETTQYVSSLVFWNFLFLIPIYVGLWNSNNCKSEAIQMFA